MVRNLLRGITFCVLWYCSILFGFLAFYCPLLPLLLFSNYAFRNITDKIFAFWELYPTAILQMLFGTKIYVHGDYVDVEETALVVMNHRTRVDWNFSWLCMFHATRKPAARTTHNYIGNGPLKQRNSYWDVLKIFNQKLRMKYVLKDEIKHIPGAGWVMQLNCFIYIARRWEQDQHKISRTLQYFHDMEYTYQLLIFPEGTDLTPTNLCKSDAHANKYNLQLYRQVLHPRVRGFSHLVTSLRGLAASGHADCKRGSLGAVYDMSVGYAGLAGQPGETCTLRDFLLGRFPPEVHFFIKRYPACSLPEDEALLGVWLNERWKAKEEQLKSFYKHGRFIDAVNRIEYRHRSELIIALVFWTSLVILYPLALLKWTWLRGAALACCGGFCLLGVFFQGFHHLEVCLYRLKANLAHLNKSKCA